VEFQYPEIPAKNSMKHQTAAS